MSSRSLPYRLKPPGNWEELTKQLSEETFYLVSTSGPTCYTIRGEHSETPFKIYIGDRQRCSCQKRAEICVHLLYVMAKVFRVPLTDPTVWQVSLLDTEVTNILDYREKQQRQRKKQTNYLKKKSNEQGNAKEEPEATAQRHELSPDEVCPICQESMGGGGAEEEGEGGAGAAAGAAAALAWCRQGCGTNVHATCMRMMASHARSQGKKVACPLCREEWGAIVEEALPDEDGQLKNPAQQGKSKKSTKKLPPYVGIHCSSCKLKVLSVFLRCLRCRDARGRPRDLCRRCYAQGGRALCHPGHPHVQGNAHDDPTVWSSAPRPEAAPVLPAHIISQLQGRELTTEDYVLLLRLDAGAGGALHDTLVRALPPLMPSPEEERQEQLMAALGPAGEDGPAAAAAATAAAAAAARRHALLLAGGNCPLCGGALAGPASARPRALPCGAHGAHESCLIAAALAAQGEEEGLEGCACPADGAPLFPALRRRRGRPKTRGAAPAPPGVPGGGRGAPGTGGGDEGAPGRKGRGGGRGAAEGGGLGALEFGLCGVGLGSSPSGQLEGALAGPSLLLSERERLPSHGGSQGRGSRYGRGRGRSGRHSLNRAQGSGHRGHGTMRSMSAGPGVVEPARQELSVGPPPNQSGPASAPSPPLGGRPPPLVTTRHTRRRASSSVGYAAAITQPSAPVVGAVNGEAVRGRDNRRQRTGRPRQAPEGLPRQGGSSARALESSAINTGLAPVELLSTAASLSSIEAAQRGPDHVNDAVQQSLQQHLQGNPITTRNLRVESGAGSPNLLSDIQDSLDQAGSHSGNASRSLHPHSGRRRRWGETKAQPVQQGNMIARSYLSPPNEANAAQGSLAWQGVAIPEVEIEDQGVVSGHLGDSVESHRRAGGPNGATEMQQQVLTSLNGHDKELQQRGAASSCIPFGITFSAENQQELFCAASVDVSDQAIEELLQDHAGELHPRSHGSLNNANRTNDIMVDGLEDELERHFQVLQQQSSSRRN